MSMFASISRGVSCHHLRPDQFMGSEKFIFTSENIYIGDNMGEIRVAIAGVGNCASALVQGVFFYKDAKKYAPGLLSPKLGKYHVRDIRFVAAFDVDARKVGKDLSEAIFSPPNCVAKFCEVPELGVEVMKGPVVDSLKGNLEKEIKVAKGKPVDVAKVLEECDAHVLVNFLPVGSEEATKAYATSCLNSGTSFLNAIPVFIASRKEWQRKFEKAGVPVAGDDVQSQIGATVLHKTILKLLVDRGVRILDTYQLNIGGNMDFLNMVSGEWRLKSKRKSKRSALEAMVPYPVKMRVGPSDFVEHLRDVKIAYINVRAQNFGALPVEIELKLKVHDSPNSAGIVIDVVRALKIAMDRGISGVLRSVSAFAFKHPPVQMPYQEAKKAMEEFILGLRND